MIYPVDSVIQRLNNLGQKFSNGHAPFAFLSLSVAVAALSGISHVACRATENSFSAFLSSGMQEPLLPPKNNFFLDQAAIKKYFGH